MGRMVDADKLEQKMGMLWGQEKISNEVWNLFRKVVREVEAEEEKDEHIQMGVR